MTFKGNHRIAKIMAVTRPAPFPQAQTKGGQEYIVNATMINQPRPNQTTGAHRIKLATDRRSIGKTVLINPNNAITR
jgi:hypothetical protein